MFKKKWYFWVILFFLVIIIAAGSGDTPTNEQTKVEPVPTATEQVQSEVNNTHTESTVTVPAPKQETKTASQFKSTNSVQTGYKVTEVVDGDTIKINMNGEIETLRLIGLDTPETVDPRKPVQCFGKEASAKGKELLLGKTVRVEADSTQDTRDKYGRLLVYVYRDDGLFYNKYMIEQGYAHEYTYETAYKHQADFKAAEQSAKTNQRGLWSPNTCNGNTTSSSTTQTPPPATTTSGEKYYTSSYYSAKYYYPESCDGWKSLSPSYLKSYNSLGELLKEYPSKTQSPSC